MTRRFDPRLFEQAVTQRLLRLRSPWKSAAFASQVALLALTSIPKGRLQSCCNEDWFDEWLFTTQRAIFCGDGLFLIANRSRVDSPCINDIISTVDVAADFSSRAADASVRSAYVAAYAATYAARSAVAAARGATYAASYAAYSVDSYVDEGRAGLILGMLNALEESSSVIGFIRDALPLDTSTLCEFQRGYGHGFEFWADWLEVRGKGDFPAVDVMESVVMLSAEVMAMPVVNINDYLLGLVVGRGGSLNFRLPMPRNLIRVNSVRCMIVGFGYVGKTSLSHVLQGKPVEPEQPMTDGFDIQPWTPKSAPELDVRLWDFAGQAMAHSCHRLFFTARCVYVIVVAAAGRQHEERLDGLLRSPTDQAEYWFEAIRPYACEKGRKVPVLLLANKDDAGRVDLDMPHLQRRFGSDFEFDQPYYLSLQQPDKYANTLQGFTSELEQRLTVVNQWQTPLPAEHHDVYRWVCDKGKDTTWLKMADFSKECDDRGITSEVKSGGLSQSLLLELLGMLGITFDFSQKSEDNSLEDQLLLQPQWLSQAITYLIRGARSQMTAAGVACLSLGKMRDLIVEESGQSDFCSKVQCRGVIEAMEQAGLAYRQDDRWVIPEALVDQEPPDEAEFPVEALTSHFAFPYAVPGQVFSRLMCALHTEVESDRVWRRGMMLASCTYQARALIRVDYGLRRITLLIAGKGTGEYFQHLLGRIRKVFEKANITDYSEWLGLPDKPNAEPEPPVRLTTAERVVDLQDLDQLRLFRQDYWHGKFGRFKVAEILKVMAGKDSKAAGDTYNQIFNITQNNGGLFAPAHGDVRDVQVQVTVNHDQRQQVIQYLNQLDTQLAGLIQQAVQSITTQPQEAVQVMQALQPAREAIATLQSPDKPEAEKQKAKGIIEGLWDGSGQVISGLAKGLDTVAKGGKAIVELNGLAEKIVPHLPLLLMAAGS